MASNHHHRHKVIPPDQKPQTLEQFSMTYGGMWREFFHEIERLRKEKEALENELTLKTEEAELLQFGKLELCEQYKQNLIELMETRSDHSELQDIFEQLQAEKDDLKGRLLGLEDHLDWIKRQNQDLQENLLYWKENFQMKLDETANKDREIDVLRSDLHEQNLVLESQRNTISDLNAEISRHEHDKCTLKKSLNQKVKIINELIKEKNLLYSEMELLKVGHNKNVKVFKNSHPKANSISGTGSGNVAIQLFTSPLKNEISSPCTTPIRDVKALFHHLSPPSTSKYEVIENDLQLESHSDLNSSNPWTTLNGGSTMKKAVPNNESESKHDKRNSANKTR